MAAMPKEKLKMMIGLLKNDSFQFCQLEICGDDTRWKESAARNEKSHIALFFVEGKYHRHEVAKVNCNSDKMTVNSSLYAVPVYAKLGFSQTDKEQVVNGMRFTPMELRLF